jgi:hypothetical protein
MAADARRAAQAAAAAAERGGANPGEETGDDADGTLDSYDALLRELVDERTYPRLYRLAWGPGPEKPPSEREEFLFGIDLILDGVQALIDRAKRGAG